MRTPTRSPTPCASRSRRCASGSVSRGSSPPSPVRDTASTRHRTPGAETVDRAPGLRVRLKLTLSYAGFIMLAGALLLAVVWVFLLRYVPDVIEGPLRAPDRSDLVRAFVPKVTMMLAFLLVF